MELVPSSRFFLESPLPTSRLATPLLGFCSPSAFKSGEATAIRLWGRSGVPGVARVCAGETHLSSYGAARRLFQPLSDLFLHTPSTIFRWMTLLGFALQGFVPLVKPHQLVTGSLPPWRFSVEVACSVLVSEPSLAHRTIPRMTIRIPLVTFEAFGRTRIDPHHSVTINVRAIDLPLLSFHLLMA